MSARFVVALSLGLWACGGSPAARAPVDKTPPPPEVMALVVHVAHNGDALTHAVGQRYAYGLAQAGLPVVSDASQPHDVEIKLATSREVVTSLFQVQVNGRVQVKVRVHVIAAFEGLQPAARLGFTQTEFEMTDGEEPDSEFVGALVLAYAKSSNVARWAKARTHEASKPATDEPTVPPGSDPADDADWYKLNPIACKVPVSLTACDDVRAYLAKRPKGAHAVDARNALAAAQPALEQLQQDDNDWRAVRPGECKRLKTKDACAGVEVYLHRYPGGLHADEAKALLH